MSSEDLRRPPSPEQEAIRIANAFEGYDRNGRHWETAGGDDDAPFGTARVCRVWPARVLHVVGASEMAEQLRSLYGSGEITGWRLQPMADTRTPLHTVERKIQAIGGNGRGYTPLARAGFVHTEEVEACPDTALLGVRNVGPNTLPIIRQVLPYTAPDVDDNSAPAAPSARRVRSPERETQLAEAFTPLTRARYRRLVDGLAASVIPETALSKIAESLNAEPAPPTDPLVELLLETAGLHGLLQLYRDTHIPPSR